MIHVCNTPIAFASLGKRKFSDAHDREIYPTPRARMNSLKSHCIGVSCIKSETDLEGSTSMYAEKSKATKIVITNGTFAC